MATLSEKKKVLKQAYKSKPTPTLKQVISIFDYLEKYRLPREERKQLLETIEKAYEKISARSLPPKQRVLKRETKGGKSLTELLKDFKAKFGKDKFREATKDTRDLVKDIERPALKKGKRIVSKRGYTTNQYGRFKNRVGTTYYETRSNRIDVNQPSKTRYPKLAMGGQMKHHRMPSQEEISKMSDAELRKAFMQWAEHEGVTDINSPNFEYKMGGDVKKKKIEVGDLVIIGKKTKGEILDIVGDTAILQRQDGKIISKPIEQIKLAELEYDVMYSDRYAKGGKTDSIGRIYVADLKEYNDGRLVGKWFDLDDYNGAYELMDAIQEFLDEQTKKDRSGEVHEEFAIHDFEGFPHRFYSEYMGEKDFEILYDAIDIAKEHNLPLSVLLEAASDLGYEDNIERVAEESYKSVPVSMGNEFRDLAMEIVADGGMESVENPDFYFDYEEYGHDVRQDYSEEEIAENGWDKLDDEELGMEIIERTGGVENLSEETIDSYFDYSRFGRDLEHDYIAVRGDDGYMYFFNRNFAKGGKFANGGKALGKETTKKITLIFDGKKHEYDATFIDGEFEDIEITTRMQNNPLWDFVENDWSLWFENESERTRDLEDMYYGEEAIYSKKGAIEDGVMDIIDGISEELKRNPNKTTFNLDKGEIDYGNYFAKGGEVAKSNKQMVQSKAKEVMHHAKELQDAIKKESDIEAWVVSKVQRASTDLSDVTHYLDGRTEYGEGGTLAGNLDVDNVGFGLKHANGGETAISDSEKKASLKNNLKLKL